MAAEGAKKPPIWVIVGMPLLGLGVMLAFWFGVSPHAIVEVPYADLIARVDAGEVAELEFGGGEAIADLVAATHRERSEIPEGDMRLREAALQGGVSMVAPSSAPTGWIAGGFAVLVGLVVLAGAGRKRG
jgi:hypothetical protein